MQKIILSGLMSMTLVVSSGAFAGAYLAKDVKIVRIGAMINVGTDPNNFGIKVEGGLPGYPCPTTANNWIKFPSSAVSPESFQRVYSTILLAYSQGAKINIYDYGSVPNCDHAMSVQIEK
jgi:hypothetical protein